MLLFLLNLHAVFEKHHYLENLYAVTLPVKWLINL